MATNVFLIMSSPGLEGDTENFGSGAINRPSGVEVHSFGFNISQVGSEEGGRPRSVENVTHTDMKIVKAVDSRSPLFFELCCKGSFVGAAELQCFGPDPRMPYLVYRMQFVHVSSYEPSGDGGVPMETIGLRFGEMAVIWDDRGLGGSKHGNGKTIRLNRNWSWVMEWPITLGNPESWMGMNGEVASGSEKVV